MKRLWAVTLEMHIEAPSADAVREKIENFPWHGEGFIASEGAKMNFDWVSFDVGPDDIIVDHVIDLAEPHEMAAADLTRIERELRD